MGSLLLSDSGSFIVFLIRWEAVFQISILVWLSIWQNKLYFWSIDHFGGIRVTSGVTSALSIQSSRVGILYGNMEKMEDCLFDI